MGFAVFLKPEVLGYDIEGIKRGDIFMNSMIVALVQIFMVVAVWHFA